MEFKFPILTIKAVRPILQKNERIFAYEIMAMTESRRIIKLYENKGLNLKDHIGKKMECLLEITKGGFEYVDESGQRPIEAFVFKYQWRKRLFEYFPKLIELHDDLSNSNTKDEHTIQELFEITTAKCFRDWGLNGLKIGIYQDKPILSSLEGFFLLNEYEFEEEIENLELDEEVYIRIDEVFLRGIRPNQSFIEQRRVFIAPEQKEEEKEIKKGRTFLE